MTAELNPLRYITRPQGRSACFNELRDGVVISRLANEYALDNAAQWGSFVSPLYDGHGAQYVRIINTNPTTGLISVPVTWDYTDPSYTPAGSPEFASPSASITYGYTEKALPDEFFRQVRVATVESMVGTNSHEGVMLVGGPGQWSVNNAAAVNAVATATRAAPGAGVAHVIQNISGSIQGSLASADAILLRVRDGAGGTILWQQYIGISATSGCHTIEVSGLNLKCTNATAAVIEFSAAGGASTYESVSMSGYTIN